MPVHGPPRRPMLSRNSRAHSKSAAARTREEPAALQGKASAELAPLTCCADLKVYSTPAPTVHIAQQPARQTVAFFLLRCCRPLAGMAANTANVMEWKTFREFHDCYFHTDVLALADGWRATGTLPGSRGLTPYYTLPGAAWDAMLRHSARKTPIHLWRSLVKFLRKRTDELKNAQEKRFQALVFSLCNSIPCVPHGLWKSARRWRIRYCSRPSVLPASYRGPLWGAPR